MSDYENKKQARIDHYRQRAINASKESDVLYKQAQKMGEAIPFGQPILIGHHSEKRDRNYRERMHGKMEKSIEADKKAAYYEAKAESAENNSAISSDDPEALTKLKEKLDGLESNHAYMVRFNRYYRKHGTCKGFEDIKDENAEHMDKRIAGDYSWCKQPYPSYTLQNDNQNIKRIKDRIASLERTREIGYVGWEFDGGHVVANQEENRLQIYFDTKPDEEKRLAMKQQGFHYSKYNNHAWQRQLNSNAIYAAGHLDFVQPLCGKMPYELQPKTQKKETLNPSSPVR